VPYLDVEKKVWKIGKLEIPVKEDIPMKEMKWFKDKYKDVIKKSESGELTQIEALEFDEEWWHNLCKIGLGKTMEEVMESNCTEKQFRDLMAELYNFLSNLGSIEEAKQFVLYVQKTENKENKQ